MAQFIAANGLEAPVPARLLDLTSEVGELAKEALKGSGYGRDAFSPPEGWTDELGDVFFSSICLANSTGVNMESALRSALVKYLQRLSDRGQAGSGR